MPDGAQIVGQDTETVSMQVSMPLDEHGFIGRQCPSCSLWGARSRAWVAEQR
jgi:hypothetical protein